MEALVADKTNLKVAIMDNYLLSYFNEVIEREPVRVHANLEQAINYGLVMAPNSSRLTECFRRFVRNNPQDIFDIILSNLKPLKVRGMRLRKLQFRTYCKMDLDQWGLDLIAQRGDRGT